MKLDLDLESGMDNFSNTTERECETHSIGIDLLTQEKVIVACCYCIIFVLGLIGNVLVMWTLFLHHCMRTGTNILLLNLSIADLFIVVVNMPDMLISYMLETYLFSNVMCKTTVFIQSTCVVSSVLTLLAISLERFFAIVYPFWSRLWQTKQHTYVTLFVIWATASVLSIPVPMFSRTYFLCRNGAWYCTEIWHPHTHFKKVYSIVSLLTQHSLPLFVMIFCYSRIGCVLWARTSALKSQTFHYSQKSEASVEMKSLNLSESCVQSTTSRKNPDSNGYSQHKLSSTTNQNVIEKTNRKAVSMLVIVVVEFFICWSPVFVTNTWESFDRRSAMSNISDKTRLIITLVSYISTCCNPITYCFLNKKFRIYFIKFLCSRCLTTTPELHGFTR